MKAVFKFLSRYIKSGFKECAECKRYDTCDRKPWLHYEEDCNYEQNRYYNKKEGGKK